ncbi:MAG: glycosyltransferase [Roseburia sp.]|nr:glycosyltransferase [Roseburia sp.]
MKLSIIVPVYNMAAEGKLEFCLDSLLNQTIAEQGVEYEILAIDDASTDASLSILRGYEKRHPGKIRVFTYPVNRRQGGAKNEGLKAARGEWLSFIDSDDWVSPDFYEKLLLKARETGADMVGCDYSLVEEHGFRVGRIVKNNSLEQTGLLDEERHQKLIMRSGSMVIKIYKASVIKENHLDFPEGIFYEDNCAGPLWSLYFTHFEKVEEPLYYYYQHGASTVHKITEAKCQDRMKAAGELYEQCKSRGFLERYYPQIEYRFTELYYVNTLLSYMQGVKRPRLSFVKELRAGQREYFPEFEKNEFYQRNTGTEEKAWLSLLGRSPLGFYWYYRLKFTVRRIKKRLRGKRGDG